MNSIAAITTPTELKPLFDEVLARERSIGEAAAVDLLRLAAINPACPNALAGLLSFRAYQTIQLYRINHALWNQGQQELAVLLQNWGATVFAMDVEHLDVGDAEPLPHVALPHDLRQGARTHARSERRFRVHTFFHGVVEKIRHGVSIPLGGLEIEDC